MQLYLWNYFIRFANLLKETFGISVFLQYCAGSLILCASTFSVSQLKPFSADFVALIIYVMCILIQIFIYCRYANELTLEVMQNCKIKFFYFHFYTDVLKKNCNYIPESKY